MKAKIRILTRRIKRSYKKTGNSGSRAGFDSDPAGNRNFCRQLCMWEENGESTRRRVAGRNEDHADPYSNTYAGTSPGK